MNDIKKHRLAIVSQIASNFQSIPKEEKLEKAEIADALSYDSKLLLTKSGAEIKKGIAEKVIEVKAQKAYCKTQMENHLQCGQKKLPRCLYIRIF